MIYVDIMCKLIYFVLTSSLFIRVLLGGHCQTEGNNLVSQLAKGKAWRWRSVAFVLEVYLYGSLSHFETDFM